MSRRSPPGAPATSEQKFEGLLESAPDAIVIVDRDGAIRIVNGQAERLFGYERAEMIGERVELLVPERLRELHVRHRAGYTTDLRARPMGIGMDLLARRKDGSEFPVEISLSPMWADEGLLITSVIRDISERNQAELALRESERRFREFVEGTDDLVVRVDPDNRFLYVNHTAERVFGFSPVECVGLSAFDFVHPEDRERTEAAFASWVAEGAASATLENRQLGRDGAVTHLLWTVNPRYDAEGALTSITSIARDITARKRLEEVERRAMEADLQLQAEKVESELRRQVLRHSITAQEEERRRIARGLHDETAQALTGLSLGLGQIEATTDLEAARSQAKRLGQQVVETLRELRRIAMRLRPSTLDDLGLVPALEQLVEESPAGATTKVFFRHQGLQGRLDPALETTIYRVVQEALTNAAKHAGARSVEVELAERDGFVVAKVRDDGRGFEPQVVAGRGLGLGGMRERAGLVGGELSVESAPGAGAAIILRVPLGTQ